MEASPQDPLVAMDLSSGYSLTRGPEAPDLALKPDRYLGSPYRSRASSSCGAAPHPEPEPLHYMSAALAPGLDLYRDGVHAGLWRPGFYGPDQTGGPVLESSAAEDSDSGSDVIFLVSSAEEPLLCGSFLPDDVRRRSPAASSPESGRFLAPPPGSSSGGSSSGGSSSGDSDGSLDIPVHHARPVVLLSDLAAVYANPAASPLDISSDDSDVVEVSITDEKKKTAARRRSPARETPPQSEDEDARPREVRRSSRIRRPASDAPPFTCGASRHRLRRRAKSDAVGIYNEGGDSDGVMDYAARLCGEDEEPASQPASQRVSSGSEESDADAQTDVKSPQRKAPSRRPPHRKVSNPKSVGRKRKPLGLRETTSVRTKRRPAAERREKNPKKKAPARRKRRGGAQTGPSLFAPREPEIQLKYAGVAGRRKTKRPGAFCPFVHVKKRTCRVVNYREEEEAVRSGGARQPAAPGPPSGFVPGTPGFRLARLSCGGGACPAAPRCSLCGQTANAAGLGDLHGPYRPAAAPPRRRQEERSLVSRRSVNSCDGDDGDERSAAGTPPPRLDEGWLHEDCGVWSAGVFLVRGRLHGLEEAARLAQETKCSACQQTGAIMGCFQKACPRKYHYRCAVQSGCVLNEENFSIRCPEHKNKLLVVNRQHKR